MPSCEPSYPRGIGRSREATVFVGKTTGRKRHATSAVAPQAKDSPCRTEMTSRRSPQRSSPEPRLPQLGGHCGDRISRKGTTQFPIPQIVVPSGPRDFAKHIANLASENTGKIVMTATIASDLFFVTLSVLAGTVSFCANHAAAHDWYPKECCGQGDCAPADSVRRKQDGSYVVLARGVSVLIPANFNQWRKSPDGRVHVCTSEYLLVCAFRGPGV